MPAIFKLALISTVLLLVKIEVVDNHASRVVDLSDSFPDLVQTRPDKNWLIKFYAPWCYACQRLEPLYHRVAEKIYHSHDHLIVGRVDCTKFSKVCETYSVQSYPTIIFINHQTKIPFGGDRSVESMVEFAERLNGPDYTEHHDCNTSDILERHNQFIISTYKNNSDLVHQAFMQVAKQMKADFWFYHLKRTCNDSLDEESLYMIKRHIETPNQFLETDVDTPAELQENIKNWLDRESFPVYGQIHRYNYEKILSLGKTLVVSVIERYEQARQFTVLSARFHKQFDGIVKKMVKQYPKQIYAWTSDLDMVRWITMGDIVYPNVMILKPDKRYLLIAHDDSRVHYDPTKEFHPHLTEDLIMKVVDRVEKDDIEYEGSDDWVTWIRRKFYYYYSLFLQMFRSNPLLTSILIIMPTATISLIIYMTCFHKDYMFDDDDDEEEDQHDLGDGQEDDERRRLINHVKQD